MQVLAGSLRIVAEKNITVSSATRFVLQLKTIASAGMFTIAIVTHTPNMTINVDKLLISAVQSGRII